ncbi:MAG: hypothetical protein IJ491_08445 [Clostridia bacterium]|nr:hypothetical protein [Clostridia bacterium]
MNEKQNIKDFKKEKEKAESIKNQGKKSSKILIGVFLAVIVVIGVYFLTIVNNLSDLSQGTDGAGIDSSVVQGDGFPVSFTSNDIVTAESFSSRIFVLTGKMLTAIKSDGKIAFTETFTFVEPEMTVSEKYGLIYDRSSSKYIIFNSKGKVYEGTTDGDRHIITACIDNKGNCAIVTKSDDSACRVYLVNKSGEIRYIWSCAEEYVVALDISSDGKEILCGSIGAYNGDILTKLYKLDTNSSESEKSFTILGSGCVGVSFYGKDKAVVTCLDKRVVLDLRTEDGAPTQAEYSSEAVFIASDFSGYTAVLTNKINSFNTDEVTLYDKNNSVVFKTEVPQGVDDICVIGKKVFCLTGDSVLYLNSNGEIKNTAECESKGDGIVILNKKAYYYTAGSLRTGF